MPRVKQNNPQHINQSTTLEMYDETFKFYDDYKSGKYYFYLTNCKAICSLNKKLWVPCLKLVLTEKVDLTKKHMLC